ncbi:Fatty-acid amide hydrolase 2 [Harpegnathos saltator]|uniref:Fatty-acid amide hydrolase 2 n=2 Tax=Harpegnathos saltator TaxID=610380 RepID=E2C7U6_HARSA|nr:Fatty-acid amide hydrolase 2 [Harpegnathos saltator]
MRIFLGLLNVINFMMFWIWSLIYRKQPSRIPPAKETLFSLSATTLARMIRQREITSYQVVYTYTERIKEVNRVLNAVVDNRFGPAIIQAKICDEQLAAGKFDAETLEKEKPLYGVPITIKECCAVKGLSYTGGSLIRKGIKATADSAVIELLYNAGAIPLCVTNTPEMSSNFDTWNLVYGATLNPYDTRYSAGGSSGGEGALLGSGASLIGIGSDVAGSIRIPAIFNGVFGHKPTNGIISTRGHIPECKDETFQRYLTFGPMTRYAEDLSLLMRVLASDCDRDLRLTVPVDLKQLKVYYLQNVDNSFGILPVSPEIQQCVFKAAHHFEQLGLHTEKLPINWPATIAEMGAASLLSMKEPPQILLSSDPKGRKNPAMELMKSLFCQPQYTKSAIFFSFLLESHFPFAKSSLSYYTKHAEVVRRELLNLLGDNGVFIYPTFRCPTTFRRLILLEFINCSYATIFNVFGFPALHVPMGLNDEGLPIGVQVIAAPYQDRLCFAVAKELETAFGGWTPPPFSGADSRKRD